MTKSSALFELEGLDVKNCNGLPQGVKGDKKKYLTYQPTSAWKDRIKSTETTLFYFTNKKLFIKAQDVPVQSIIVLKLMRSINYKILSDSPHSGTVINHD